MPQPTDKHTTERQLHLEPATLRKVIAETVQIHSHLTGCSAARSVASAAATGYMAVTYQEFAVHLESPDLTDELFARELPQNSHFQ